MALLFEGTIAQYIDGAGKTRMLTYDFEGEELCLMTSPIPPLDLPESRDIKEAPFEAALKFIKSKDLKISLQDGNEKQGIQGIWVETTEENPSIYFGYIPVEVSKPIKGVAYAGKNDPIRTDPISDLTNLRYSRKIAEFLKQYTLFSYANDPENFGEDSFVVVPDHTYDISSLNKRLILDNEVMYLDGRLIVPSEETKKRLLSFLRVSLINDTPGVMNMKNTSTIENFYQTISDFRSTEHQLVFMNKNGMMRWRNEHTRMEHNTKVSDSVHQDASEPYLYRSPAIRGAQLMIVQNVVDGNLENAIAVGYKWIKDRVNIGYRPRIPSNIDNISYLVYSDVGELERAKKTTKETVSLLRYENDTYAALLFV
jgi:hypothetical protein